MQLFNFGIMCIISIRWKLYYQNHFLELSLLVYPKAQFDWSIYSSFVTEDKFILQFEHLV